MTLKRCYEQPIYQSRNDILLTDGLKLKVYYSHETTIIGKQVENLIKTNIKLNKGANRKLNKYFFFPKSKSILWKYSVLIK